MDTQINLKVVTTEAERALGRLNSAISALGGAFVGNQIMQFVDSITAMQNKLRNVTTSTAQFNKVQNQLYAVANSTGAAVEDTATLYQKLALSADSAGLSSAGVMKMTELVSKQMAQAGMSTQETSAFLTQFGQAMASGKLSGDEFRTMTETNVPMLHMLAKSLGVTVGELKKMGSEGKLTSKIITDAFLKNEQAINSNQPAVMTLGQSFNVLTNNAKRLFSEMNDGTGILGLLSSAILVVANNLKTVVVAATTFMAALAVQRIASMTTAVGGLSAAFATLNTIMKANIFAILITALVTIGTIIYDSVIKPLKDAGLASGIIARYMAEQFVNAWIQLGEFLYRAVAGWVNIMYEGLTGGDMQKAYDEMGKQMDAALTRRTVKFVSDDELKKIQAIGKAVADVTAQEDLRKQALEAQAAEAEKAQKAFIDTVFKMKLAVDYERQKLSYGEKYAETQKVIAEETQKLAKGGLTITAQQKQDLASLVAQQYALKDIAATRQVMVGLADQITVLGERDQRSQEIKQGLLQYQRSVTAETYNLNKGTVEQYMRQAQVLKDMTTYAMALKEIEQDTAVASIVNSRQREIQGRLLQYQNQVSKEVFAATKTEVETQLRKNQIAKESVNIQEEMLVLQDEINVAMFNSTKQQEILTKLNQRFQGSSQEVQNVYKDQYETLLRKKQTLEEINSLTESEAALGIGVGAEYAKTLQKILIVGKAQKVLNEEYSSELAKINKQDELSVKHLEMWYDSHFKRLEGQMQNYKNQRKLIEAQITGDFLVQAETKQKIEMDQLQNSLDRNIITHETYLKAVKDLEYRYADEIAQYKILKEMELQGNRAKIMAGNIQLMTVDRATAEKIAQDRVAFEKKTEFDKSQFFIDQSATVFNALGKQNKEAFKAAQALNIAVALMNTYRAASVALATYPWPFSLVAVAAAVATGLAQVAAIRSQSYSGRALGGGVMGGSSYIVGERGPELFTPTNSGKITRNQDLGAGSGTTVNFTVVANDTRGFDELLTARKGLITQIIQDAQLEKGRRI